MFLVGDVDVLVENIFKDLIIMFLLLLIIWFLVVETIVKVPVAQFFVEP